MSWLVEINEQGRSSVDIDSSLTSAVIAPTRYSFANNFLVSMVSKMGIEIEVQYYERDDVMLIKVDAVVIVAKDAPLMDTFMKSDTLSEKFKCPVLKERGLTIRCYAGDIAGDEILLTSRPKDIQYVIDATKNHTRPVIILCRGPLKEETERQDNGHSVHVTGRTASGMVQELLELQPSARRAPLSLETTPNCSRVPPMSASLSHTRYSLISPERTSSSNPKHNMSPRWMVMEEEGEGYNLELGANAWSEEEEERCVSESSHQSSLCKESSSSLSSCSTCTSEDGDQSSHSVNNAGIKREYTHTIARVNGLSSPCLTSNFKTERRKVSKKSKEEDHYSHEVFIKQLATKKLKQKPLDSGFLTLRPKKHKAKQITGLKSMNRFSLKPRKAYAIDVLEISHPSLMPAVVQQNNTASKSLIRQSAIRGKKGQKTVAEPQPTLTIPEISYSFEVTSVNVAFKGNSMKVKCREFNTVHELKDSIAWHLNKMDPDRCTPWKGSEFIVTYENNEKFYELFNDWQFIYKTTLYQLWGEKGCTDTPIQAHLPTRGITEDTKVVYRISQLVGVSMDNRIDGLPGADVSKLRRVAGPDHMEAEWTRRVLHNFVEEVISNRDKECYSLSMELVSSSTSTILALKIPIDSRIKVIFHYKQCFSLVKHLKVQRTAESILHEIFPCLVACGLVEHNIDDYTMQISGEKSYIAGKYELMSFRDIRRCIIKGEPLNLSITDKPKIMDDSPCTLNWRLLDPQSGKPPLHTDISHSAQRDFEVQALSSWDRDDEFIIRVETVTNLPILSNKTSCSIILEATLYHGDKPLCAPVTTTTKVLEPSVQWRETLNFKVCKKNIPRAAKILFLVSEALQRRESVGVKKTAKFLFWGLSMVFDHQGMMFNGEHTMLLWKGRKEKEEKKEGTENHMPNPCGPASNNSDPQAVTLTIKFDSYCFPIHFPSCSPQSWSVLLVKPSVANVAVRRQFQRLLEFIRDGRLHVAVPAYIEKVNWGSLAESLEVYSLLDQISDAKLTFPVEIALKLLDCDFPDQSVREFATRVLYDLPDERLEDFLLQLTQALKFEPHHDSLLGRFLLSRALCNKRIGHFLFWYLRCEMVNPQYTTRFGVLLEAYLMGCGESMLRQFEDQVEMQTTLEEIATVMKQRCNDDQNKMQLMLPDMLNSYCVPEFEITPVYNPRMRLGNLRPNKCKIMASKKKPQWLEMYNVDATSLELTTPIRFILKMGDDLRQDMITLRMFSLFEKLWEEDGLDLALIPYGCIATGPDTGFIEVVKNARTIAEVSGVNNQTKLLDWIKSHQKNEFGEEDLDNIRSAVKTFVHSCAGYSVATYVLGIGDRHNDNIMVTTSGNLFHIDFGHFLGNIKYCMGFKREWAPFVLTPDFVYTMGGEESSSFDTYKNLCCRAFLTLRRHAELIINLFSLMRCTGIPELTCVEDTEYIRNALVLEKSEHEAEQMFRKVIKKCLDLKWTVQVMWKFHLLRKRGSS